MATDDKKREDALAWYLIIGGTLALLFVVFLGEPIYRSFERSRRAAFLERDRNSFAEWMSSLPEDVQDWVSSKGSLDGIRVAGSSEVPMSFPPRYICHCVGNDPASEELYDRYIRDRYNSDDYGVRGNTEKFAYCELVFLFKALEPFKTSVPITTTTIYQKGVKTESYSVDGTKTTTAWQKLELCVIDRRSCSVVVCEEFVKPGKWSIGAHYMPLNAMSDYLRSRYGLSYRDDNLADLANPL